MAEANRRQAVDPKVYQRKTEYVEDVDYGAEISKITEPIGLELANREAQKDKIQKDYESVEEQLQNFEFDTESDNSSLVLDLVNKAKAANYENNQLVINGKIPPIDGQKRQARISNQMKEAGKANKTWNENLEKKSKRATDLISAPSEIAATSAINQFSNTKGLQSYVDDTGNIWTYRADTRKEIEDPNNPGQMIKNPDFNKTPDFKTQPGKFIAYSRINEQMQYESNRANFDVGAIIGAKNKELGKFVTSMGLETTVDGATGRSVLTKKSLAAINSNSDLKKLWDTYKENTSNTLTYDNEAVANILALNEGYQIVLSQEDFDELKKTDPELRDDQMILMNTLESPPTFTFKGGQDVATNAAKDVVKNQIDVDMGFVEERSSTQFPPQPSAATNQKDKDDQKLIGFLDDVNAIVSDDEETFRATANDRIVSLNKGKTEKSELIDSIIRDDAKITITYQDGKKSYVNRVDDKDDPIAAEKVSKDLWRYLTDEDDDSFKYASDIYSDEDGGGFRDSSRDMTGDEKISFIANQRAVEKLKKDGIKPGTPNYEKALAKEVIDLSENISEDDKKLITKRVIAHKKGERYSALAPLSKIKTSDSGIVTEYTEENPKGIQSTGTKLIRDTIGDRIDGLGGASVGGDDYAEIQETSSKVLNAYLPKEIEGGAQLIFSKEDYTPPTGANIPEGYTVVDGKIDGLEESIVIEYFDQFGEKQFFIADSVEVGYLLTRGGTTPDQLNKILHTAAQDIVDKENVRRTTRNQKGVSKSRKKFN
tara:strand:- start:4379 stop:6685 length:2307 start_codon:yes stop_codon:yes gene_type:complete